MMPAGVVVASLLLGLGSLAATAGGAFAQDSASNAHLEISEVLPNAGAGREDALHEWVELRNTSDRALSLSGWTIEDNTARDALPDLELAAGAFAVIVADAAAATDAAAGALLLPIEDAKIGNGLANGGDRLLLRSPAGQVVAAVSWGSDTRHALVPAPRAGASIALGTDGWVINTTPSPGGDLVTPQLGTLLGDAATPTDEAEARFPLWAALLAGLGVPVAYLAMVRLDRQRLVGLRQQLAGWGRR